MSSPSIQNAGHMRWPRDMVIRASKWPYVCVNRPEVFRHADVYSHVPYQHW